MTLLKKGVQEDLFFVCNLLHTNTETSFFLVFLDFGVSLVFGCVWVIALIPTEFIPSPDEPYLGGRLFCRGKEFFDALEKSHYF